MKTLIIMAGPHGELDVFTTEEALKKAVAEISQRAEIEWWTDDNERIGTVSVCGVGFARLTKIEVQEENS